MGKIITLPDVHQGYYTARKVLADPSATREQIIAACDVLMHSPDWMDIVFVRKARTALWTSTASEHGANFNRRHIAMQYQPPADFEPTRAYRPLTEEELASIGMGEPPRREPPAWEWLDKPAPWGAVGWLVWGAAMAFAAFAWVL